MKYLSWCYRLSRTIQVTEYGFCLKEEKGSECNGCIAFNLLKELEGGS